MLVFFATRWSKTSDARSPHFGRFPLSPWQPAQKSQVRLWNWLRKRRSRDKQPIQRGVFHRPDLRRLCTRSRWLESWLQPPRPIEAAWARVDARGNRAYSSKEQASVLLGSCCSDLDEGMVSRTTCLVGTVVLLGTAVLCGSTLAVRSAVAQGGRADAPFRQRLRVALPDGLTWLNTAGPIELADLATLHRSAQLDHPRVE